MQVWESNRFVPLVSTRTNFGPPFPRIHAENHEETSTSGEDGSRSTAEGSSGNESEEVEMQLQTEPKRKGRPRKLDVPDYINVLENGKYQCTICEKEFKTKGYIKTHEFCAKKDGEKPYKCEECKKSFTFKSHFEYHQMSQHGGVATFQCKSCPRAFYRKRELKRHEYTHTGEKLFECQSCKKSFTSNQMLKTHIRTHTGERPYTCDVCQRAFINQTLLRRHGIVHTDNWPYKCPHCTKAFRHKSAVNTHISYAHSHEKRFKCDDCDRSFTTRRDMRRHRDAVHANEKPHVCCRCGQAFSRKDNLSRHLKSQHGAKETEISELIQAVNTSLKKSSEMEISSDENGEMEISSDENGEMETSSEENGEMETNPEENGVKQINPEENGVKQINPEENGANDINPEENGEMEPNPEENGVKETNPSQLYNFNTRKVVQSTTNWEHYEKLHPTAIIRPSLDPIDAQDPIFINLIVNACLVETSPVTEAVFKRLQNLEHFGLTDKDTLTLLRDEGPFTSTEISSTDTKTVTVCDADKDNSLFAGVLSGTLSKSEIEQKVQSGIPWKGVRNKLGESLLHIAVKVGNVVALEYLCSLDTEKKEIDSRNEAGYTPLHTAALYNKGYATFVETIVTLLINGASISSADNHGNNLFHLTASTGRLRELKFLKSLRGNLSIAAKNNDGSTLLHVIHLSKDNYTEMLKFLVNNGVDINEGDKLGNCMLHFAAAYKSAKEINEIFKLGGQLRKENNRGFLPIHAAVANGNMGVVRRMIDMDNTLLDVRSKEGRTLLHEVTFASKNFVQLINTLVNLGGNLNAEDEEKMTPLIYYLLNGRPANKAELDCLIAREPDWKAKDFNGAGTLHLAAAEGLIHVVQYLIEKQKLDVNGETTATNATPLHYLPAAQEKFMEILELLCENGAQVHKKDNDGDNLLMLTASSECRSVEDIKQVLNLGLDIHDTNNDGYSVLHFSAQDGNKEVLEYLISINASVNVKSKNGSTPIHRLMLTKKDEFQEKLDVLLGANGDLNAVDNDGNNALFLTIRDTQRGTKDLEYLVNCGADWELINKKGENVVQIATESGNLEALKYFVSLGASTTTRNKKGETLLCSVSKSKENFQEMSRFLVGECGLDPLNVDKDGNSLLHCAVKEKHSKKDLEYLVKELRIPVDGENIHYRTPLALAKENRFYEAMEYLKKVKSSTIIVK